MSKSRGNTVEPWEVLDRYGADAFRWYFFTSKQPWDGYRFSAETIGEGVRLFLKQLWSTYYFYVLYARAAAEQLAGAPASGRGRHGDLDRWALSRTAATAELVAERLDAYDATSAGRAIAELVDELSNWYVRRSRRRFWDGEPAAFATLRTCLLTVAKLLAPVLPVHRRRDLRQPRRRARERAPVRLPRAARRSAPRDERARAGDGARARDGAPRSRRPRQGEDQGPPAARRGGRRRRRTASARRSNASPTSCARSSTSRASASSRPPTSSAATRSRPTTARLGPDVRQGDAAGRRGDRGARPGPRRRRGARRRQLGISVGGRDHTLSAPRT